MHCIFSTFYLKASCNRNGNGNDLRKSNYCSNFGRWGDFLSLKGENRTKKTEKQFFVSHHRSWTKRDADLNFDAPEKKELHLKCNFCKFSIDAKTVDFCVSSHWISAKWMSSRGFIVVASKLFETRRTSEENLIEITAWNALCKLLCHTPYYRKSVSKLDFHPLMHHQFWPHEAKNQKLNLILFRT